MNERFGFALVLIVAAASVASMLFLAGASTTGYVASKQLLSYGRTVDFGTDECRHVLCPAHAPATPLVDQYGRIVYQDNGRPVCLCPLR
ncbi:MAG: hypothetical protein QXT19_01530 [Candidatus Woesearchaeota archaeon]